MSIINSKKSVSENVDSIADFLTNKTMEVLGGRGLSTIEQQDFAENKKSDSDTVKNYFDKGGYTV